jgi:signal transduction histidine kinase
MNVAAIATWIVCGLSPLVLIARGEFTGWPAAAFVAAFVLFGGALLAVLFQPAASKRPIVSVAVVGMQSLTALAMLALTLRYTQGSGATSAALVIVAAELPYLMPPAVSWTWIALQSVCMAGVLQAASRIRWIETLTFAAAIGGFQLFAASSSVLARRQAEARLQLARANDELRATRARLAESSRAEERVRISRDLHDALGHHLTALSLQLDVASRLIDGKPAEHVRQAHAITRLLLGDVRDVVSRLRDGGPVDLVRALRALTAPASEVSLHLDLPAQLAIDDRDRASAVVRCVQEVITNTARHAHARNLWVRLESRGNGVAIHAHDDGQGAETVTPGHGLTGMRERFLEHGGSVEFAAAPGTGFDVRAFMPGPGPA